MDGWRSLIMRQRWSTPFDIMTEAATGWGSRVNVAVGLADRSGEQFAQSARGRDR